MARTLPSPDPSHRPRSNALLASVYNSLRATGRGKHVGPFSYYHLSLVRSVDAVAERLDSIRQSITHDPPSFNVVKLNDRSRVSFLLYEDFATPFPALLAAVSCDLSGNTVRHTDYSSRSNPPILHRRELLLPHDDPIVPAAAALTNRLERLGAFTEPKRIGTRDGWRRRLAALGIDAAVLSP